MRRHGHNQLGRRCRREWSLDDRVEAQRKNGGKHGTAGTGLEVLEGLQSSQGAAIAGSRLFTASLPESGARRDQVHADGLAKEVGSPSDKSELGFNRNLLGPAPLVKAASH